MTTGYVRSPRCIVQTDAGMFAPESCEVTVSQHQSADTFSAKIALDDPSGLDESYWADTAPINVTVLATNDINSAGLTQMFIGVADKIEIDFESRMVHVSGRDKTAKMIDAKTNEKWLNKQPNDIITDLAGRVGLSVNFSGQATDRAGLKFNQDYNRISELDSNWNVIVRLARQMGCIAFVKGNVLQVQPIDGGTGGNYTIQYQKPTSSSYAQANFVKLTCHRDLNLAKKIKVNHKSWQHKQGKAIESEYELDGAGSDTLEHTLKGANLTKQQQDAHAQSRINDIASHERTITVDTVGDVNIDPSMMLVLNGTGTGFDQSYIISDIQHRWGWGEGYKMSIRVRNKDKKRGKAKQNK
jgi:phage protein D